MCLLLSLGRFSKLFCAHRACVLVSNCLLFIDRGREEKNGEETSTFLDLILPHHIFSHLAGQHPIITVFCQHVGERWSYRHSDLLLLLLMLKQSNKSVSCFPFLLQGHLPHVTVGDGEHGNHGHSSTSPTPDCSPPSPDTALKNIERVIRPQVSAHVLMKVLQEQMHY